MKYDRIYDLKGKPVKYETVLSLTAGASGTWHFPMELFVGLAGVSREELINAVVHIPGESRYIHSWLKLLKVRFKEVTTASVIHAQKLIVPQGREFHLYAFT